MGPVDTPVRVVVTIDYFKDTGKWYGEGSFEMDLPSIPASWRVRDRIKEMRRDGTRPGLVDDSNCGFVWVVRVRHEGEEHAQFLFLPERLENWLDTEKWSQHVGTVSDKLRKTLTAMAGKKEGL